MNVGLKCRFGKAQRPGLGRLAAVEAAMNEGPILRGLGDRPNVRMWVFAARAHPGRPEVWCPFVESDTFSPPHPTVEQTTMATLTAVTVPETSHLAYQHMPRLLR